MTAAAQEAAFGPVRWDWTRPSILLALATVAIHLFVNSGYGFFRDELYFIVCGNHPAWGYVDQPPIVPLIAALSHHLFGNFLVGFRWAPMLAMTATVALTAEFARMLGGGRFAQWLAGLCALGAPVYLAEGLLITTDLLQPLTWLACGWFLVRLAQRGDERWWIPFGIVVGISLLSKYMIAFYLLALGAGVLATPLRRSLTRPWLYVGAAIAFVMVLPNVLWQQQHGWPFLELGEAATNGKNVALSPLDYFAQQLLLIGPLAAPVWLSGLWACAARPRLTAHRIFPIAYVILFAFFVATHGKGYYLSPIYPTLLGFGAVAIEGWITSIAARAAALAAVVLVGAFLSPLAVPVLPVNTYIAYARAIGYGPSTMAMEHNKIGPLPQVYADMFGWREMAAKVAKVYWSLPPQDRAKAVFYGNNYGEAAAIDVFGRPLGLPPAISGHNNYFLWGLHGHDGSVVIRIGGNRDELLKEFRRVDQAGYIDTPYAMPYETNQPIYVERDLLVPLGPAWASSKHFE
ncbi:MAG: glycosyltransferase family 39 protein [Alphaproteobacteria bacterium]|nr:glycosyltransferase family 39 protein [Alphaproteobacteria bacterium]MDE2110457.1 glycosyltransferase family 39 protein [Alphaproteobacteria bacterium]MDE2493208.1 glycosyltransferase family 39 protein [Alphaproteobacteria bacterium]